MNYLQKDKKISALSSIDLILIKDIGIAEVVKKTFDEIQLDIVRLSFVNREILSYQYIF